MEDKGEGTSEETINPENVLEKKRSQRSQSRRRITLAIKRIREILDKDQVQANKALRKDYEIAREQNGELYDLVEAEEHDTLDQWENDLANDIFSIEGEVEVSLIALEENQVNTSGSVEDASHASNTSDSVEDSSHASNTSSSMGDASHASNTSGSVGDANNSSNADDSVGEASHASNASDANSSVGNSGQSSGTNVSANSQVQPIPAQDLTIVENHAGHTSTNNVEAQQTIQTSKQPHVSHKVALNVAPKGKVDHARPFDFWIDDLLEFQETVLPKSDVGNVTIANALFKLEANKGIPSIQLPSFDGDPLSYTDFIDQFKIHIHDKVHLKDVTRMIQLHMLLKGEADRAISSLGSKGIMYATALKCLKEQFGQPSVIARAVVNKLTMGDRIGRISSIAFPSCTASIIMQM